MVYENPDALHCNTTHTRLEGRGRGREHTMAAGLLAFHSATTNESWSATAVRCRHFKKKKSERERGKQMQLSGISKRSSKDGSDYDFNY